MNSRILGLQLGLIKFSTANMVDITRPVLPPAGTDPQLFAKLVEENERRILKDPKYKESLRTKYPEYFSPEAQRQFARDLESRMRSDPRYRAYYARLNQIEKENAYLRIPYAQRMQMERKPIVYQRSTTLGSPTYVTNPDYVAPQPRPVSAPQPRYTAQDRSWHQAVMSKYKDIGTAGTPANRAFVDAVKSKGQANFNPMQLANEVMGKLQNPPAPAPAAPAPAAPAPAAPAPAAPAPAAPAPAAPAPAFDNRATLANNWRKYTGSNFGGQADTRAMNAALTSLGNRDFNSLSAQERASIMNQATGPGRRR